MYEVDARGLSCPEPVLLTAAALKKHKGETVRVLVSEPHTRMNVEKYAKSQGDRKSTRLNSSHSQQSRMPSSA